jgi:hypothetical protein
LKVSGFPECVVILAGYVFVRAAIGQNGIHEAVGSIPSSSTKKNKRASQTASPFSFHGFDHLIATSVRHPYHTTFMDKYIPQSQHSVVIIKCDI